MRLIIVASGDDWAGCASRWRGVREAVDDRFVLAGFFIGHSDG